MKRSNFLIGITGNIGSGKSTVLGFLKSKNYVVLSADDETANAYIQAKPKLIERFSSEILGGNGEIDRKKLGEIVFSNEEKRKELNEILHPIIIETLFSKAKQLGGLVFVEVPLLFELSLQNRFDEVWLVDTTNEIKIERVQKRDGITKENALKRLKSQDNSSELKRQFSHIIIENSGDIQNLKTAVDVELAKLEERLEK
ncbi:MAG: dephospho-CoA kinase [Clostridia bacterium]